MLTVLTLLKVNPSPNGDRHGERPFWREFGPRYLDAWLASVERWIPDPKRIVVMTDEWGVAVHTRQQSAIADAVELDKTVDAPGFWAKLEMFRHGIGKSLYCDLDNVINGPLDLLCALEPDPLIMLDDRRVPGLPNGSVILFDADECRDIWRDYTLHPREVERTYVAHGNDFSCAYDQAFIANWMHCLPSRPPRFLQEMLPPGYILNARSELPNATDWRSARLIFGGGAEGKPHVSDHPGFALR